MCFGTRSRFRKRWFGRRSGFGTGVSAIAAGVYLSETFAARWRAWGVGTLNNFY